MPALTSTSDRLGRSLVLSAESETTEIIRRRLFQWNAQDISQGGTIMVSEEARDTCKAYFPEKTTDIPNRPVLAFAVLSSDHAMQDGSTLKLIESMLRQCGNSDRAFKSGILFAIADSDVQLREEARKLLAWEDIRDEEAERLNDNQKRQLNENTEKAKRDVREATWRTYKYVVLLGKDNTLRSIDLGLVISSADQSMTSLVLSRLRADDEVQDRINARFLVRNWTPAFQEWSTKANHC